ncbi:glycosyltransferase family 2 protein [Priestia filamentosa]|uniref:glycosyltransferase family 2 protein n=1 Tax=Priestia filamentosa TaxID=1402861 RepID=UPI0002EED590|nr:glycosyltransferase [Priestia filamentosa]
MQRPTISIVIPVYKAELFLNQCIDSILNQTFSDFEIILINDGSPDRCGEICDEYAMKDSRIRVIHKENEGVSVARNTGIDCVTGKFLTFVDSDDWIEPNMLEENVRILEKTESDLLVTGIIFEYLNENNSQVRKSSETINATSKRAIGESIILLEKARIFGYAANKIYRTDLIKSEKLKFNKDVTYMEDLLFICEVYRKIKSVHISNKAYYHYCIRGEGSLSSGFTPNLYQTIGEISEQIDSLFKYYNIESREYPANLPDGYIHGIQTCIYNNYHINCDWSNKEKRHFLYTILRDQKFIEQMNNFRPSDFYSKLFVKLIRTKSPFLINMVYNYLFNVRYHFTPIYSFIRRKLL